MSRDPVGGQALPRAKTVLATAAPAERMPTASSHGQGWKRIACLCGEDVCPEFGLERRCADKSFLISRREIECRFNRMVARHAELRHDAP